jgi:hypothetical protein
MKMKTYILVVLVSLTIISVKCKQRNETVNRIHFYYENTLRIPNHIVDIEILSMNDSSILEVKTFPLLDSVEWNYSRIDTSFTISNIHLEQIIGLIRKIPEENIKENKEIFGLDGSLWKIEVGQSNNMKVFEVWSPDYETEKRKLTEFVEASRMIVKLSTLKVDQILNE